VHKFVFPNFDFRQAKRFGYLQSATVGLGVMAGQKEVLLQVRCWGHGILNRPEVILAFVVGTAEIEVLQLFGGGNFDTGLCLSRF